MSVVATHPALQDAIFTSRDVFVNRMDAIRMVGGLLRCPPPVPADAAPSPAAVWRLCARMWAIPPDLVTDDGLHRWRWRGPRMDAYFLAAHVYAAAPDMCVRSDLFWRALHFGLRAGDANRPVRKVCITLLRHALEYMTTLCGAASAAPPGMACTPWADFLMLFDALEDFPLHMLLDVWKKLPSLLGAPAAVAGSGDDVRAAARVIAHAWGGGASRNMDAAAACALGAPLPMSFCVQPGTEAIVHTAQPPTAAHDAAQPCDGLIFTFDDSAWVTPCVLPTPHPALAVPAEWALLLVDRALNHDNFSLRRNMLHRLLLLGVPYEEGGQAHSLTVDATLVSDADVPSVQQDERTVCAQPLGLYLPPWYVASRDGLQSKLADCSLFRGAEDQLGRALQRYLRCYASMLRVLDEDVTRLTPPADAAPPLWLPCFVRTIVPGCMVAVDARSLWKRTLRGLSTLHELTAARPAANLCTQYGGATILTDASVHAMRLHMTLFSTRNTRSATFERHADVLALLMRFAAPRELQPSVLGLFFGSVPLRLLLPNEAWQHLTFVTAPQLLAWMAPACGAADAAEHWRRMLHAAVQEYVTAKADVHPSAAPSSLLAALDAPCAWTAASLARMVSIVAAATGDAAWLHAVLGPLLDVLAVIHSQPYLSATTVQRALLLTQALVACASPSRTLGDVHMSPGVEVDGIVVDARSPVHALVREFQALAQATAFVGAARILPDGRLDAPAAPSDESTVVDADLLPPGYDDVVFACTTLRRQADEWSQLHAARAPAQAPVRMCATAPASYAAHLRTVLLEHGAVADQLAAYLHSAVSARIGSSGEEDTAARGDAAPLWSTHLGFYLTLLASICNTTLCRNAYTDAAERLTVAALDGMEAARAAGSADALHVLSVLGSIALRQGGATRLLPRIDCILRFTLTLELLPHEVGADKPATAAIPATPTAPAAAHHFQRCKWTAILFLLRALRSRADGGSIVAGVEPGSASTCLLLGVGLDVANELARAVLHALETADAQYLHIVVLVAGIILPACLADGEPLAHAVAALQTCSRAPLRADVRAISSVSLNTLAEAVAHAVPMKKVSRRILMAQAAAIIQPLLLHRPLCYLAPADWQQSADASCVPSGMDALQTAGVDTTRDRCVFRATAQLVDMYADEVRPGWTLQLLTARIVASLRALLAFDSRLETNALRALAHDAAPATCLPPGDAHAYAATRGVMQAHLPLLLALSMHRETVALGDDPLLADCVARAQFEAWLRMRREQHAAASSVRQLDASDASAPSAAGGTPSVALLCAVGGVRCAAAHGEAAALEAEWTVASSGVMARGAGALTRLQVLLFLEECTQTAANMRGTLLATEAARVAAGAMLDVWTDPLSICLHRSMLLSLLTMNMVSPWTTDSSPGTPGQGAKLRCWQALSVLVHKWGAVSLQPDDAAPRSASTSCAPSACVLRCPPGLTYVVDHDVYAVGSDETYVRPRVQTQLTSLRYDDLYAVSSLAPADIETKFGGAGLERAAAYAALKPATAAAVRGGSDRKGRAVGSAAAPVTPAQLTHCFVDADRPVLLHAHVSSDGRLQLPPRLRDDEVAAVFCTIVCSFALRTIQLPSVKQYIDMCVATMAARFPDTVLRDAIIPVCRELNATAQVAIGAGLVAATVVPHHLRIADALIIAAATTPHVHSTAAATALATAAASLRSVSRAMFMALFPWACGAVGIQRVLAQICIHEAAPALFPELVDGHAAHAGALASTPADAGAATWLLPVLQLLRGNNESLVMMQKQAKPLIRLRAQCTSPRMLEALVASPTSEHGELIPRDVVAEVRDAFTSVTCAKHIVDQFGWAEHEALDAETRWALSAHVLPAAAMHDYRLRAAMPCAAATATGADAPAASNFQRKFTSTVAQNASSLHAAGVDTGVTSGVELAAAALPPLDAAALVRAVCGEGTEAALHIDAMRAERHPILTDVTACGRHVQPLIVVASLVEKATNLGGLARTCEILAAEALIVPDLRVKNDHQFKDVSMGGAEWMSIAECAPTKVVDFCRAKRAQGYTIVGCEQAMHSQPLGRATLPARMVLVLGAEMKGMPADVIAELDMVIEIPQFGILRSLNVHVSGAFLMWEYTRQRLASHARAL